MAVKKVAGNVGVTYNANALKPHLNTASYNAVVNAIQTTNFNSTAEQNIAGLPGFSVEVGGPWSPTLDGFLGPDSISPPTTLRTFIVTIDTVTYTWSPGAAEYGAFISNYTINASSPADGITWSGTLTCSGAPVRA
jgi:hypothetical protein